MKQYRQLLRKANPVKPARRGHGAKPTFETAILKRLAHRAGVKIITEPTYGYAGQILLPNGRKKYYLNTAFDLNPLGASRVASDKHYAEFFMKRMGYRTIPGDVFFTPRWCRIIKSRKGLGAAWRYAKRLGLPVMVKPNSLSQGAGVSVIYGKKELIAAVSAFSDRARVFLIQKIIHGHDYRIVVLDKKVISAYERKPLSVVGDGRSSISLLLKIKQAEFIRQERDTKINPKDFRMVNRLKRLNMSIKSIPSKNEEVVLLDNSNLSSGGEATDVTRTIHPQWKKLAVALTRDMGLRYAGVDMILQGDITKPGGVYNILEVNDAPGIDHYATLGNVQKKIVADMYLQILRALKK